MQLDFETGVALIAKAREQERDDRIFAQWTAQLSVMAFTGKVESYAAYRDRVTGANIDFRPTSEILAELNEVEKQFRKEG